MIHYLHHFHLPFNLAALRHQIKGCDQDEPLEHAWQFIQPKVWWREAAITELSVHGLTLGDQQLIIPSAYVAKGLSQCHKATVLAVTIGEELPKQVNQWLASNQLYQGTIGDMVGSYAVEQLAEQFCQYLQQQSLPKGLYSTLRFSPGYGDWALEEQQSVMAFLDHCQGKIALTENFLLQPVKSITAIIGWSQQWQNNQYPQGNHGSGFCNGGHNCAACTTWACRS